jgi:hypothetical protein
MFSSCSLPSHPSPSALLILYHQSPNIAFLPPSNTAMHFSTTLLGLATLATAIDVSLWDGSNCGGSGIVWRNVDPNVCCAWNNDLHQSARWEAIPVSWHLNVSAYRRNNCEQLVTSRDTNDQATVCLGGESSLLFLFVFKTSFYSARCDADVKYTSL